MDLFTVMTQVGAAVKTIAGLRVYPWAQSQITPPGALVTLPASIDYHATYGTGLQRISDLVVVVIVGKASDRVALKRICEYAHPTGARSVKKAIETYGSYTALDNVTVTSAEFGPAQQLDSPEEYLAAMFHCDINGPAT